MTSKKGETGSSVSSIRRVREAIRGCGCSSWEFFIRASQVEGLPQGLSLTDEIYKFSRLEKEGIASDPPYNVPEFVLDFAEKVLAQKDPRGFFKNPWAGTLPAPARRV